MSDADSGAWDINLNRWLAPAENQRNMSCLTAVFSSSEFLVMRFLRVADAEGIHIELSAELQQYYDRDVTTPPRLWHTRPMALNLWGSMPAWMREEVKV